MSDDDVTGEDLLALCSHLCRLGGWERVADVLAGEPGTEQLVEAAEELRWSGRAVHKDAHWQLALVLDELAGQRSLIDWESDERVVEVSLPYAESLLAQAAREIDGGSDIAAVLCAEGTPANRALSIAELLER